MTVFTLSKQNMLFSQLAIYRTDPTAALNSSFLKPTNLTSTSLTDSTVHIQTLHFQYHLGQNYKTVFLKDVKAKPKQIPRQMIREDGLTEKSRDLSAFPHACYALLGYAVQPHTT